jgi:hypothetical protein
MGMARRSLIGLMGLLATLSPPRRAVAQTQAQIQRSREDQSTQIAYLIDFIRHSPCTFIRNGSDYDGAAAADHIQQKYDYLSGRINSVEDFITYAATKSSFSGRPYLVRCADGQEQPAADWLRTELKAYISRSGTAAGN